MFPVQLCRESYCSSDTEILIIEHTFSIEDKQSILFETSRPNRLFSEPTLPQKRTFTWLYRTFTNIYSLFLSFTHAKLQTSLFQKYCFHCFSVWVVSRNIDLHGNLVLSLCRHLRIRKQLNGCTNGITVAMVFWVQCLL